MVDGSARARILRQSLSIALAVAPFGAAFGVACADAGLSITEAMGFSVLMFTGGSQFAAVGVLADGGSASTAIAAAVLLALRSLAYGVLMAPILRGDVWFRALASQLVIDESVAVGLAQPSEAEAERRYGFFATGIAIFVLWNTATILGVVAGASAGDLVETLGVDATIPASFLALLWPRLADHPQRAVALGGALIATALIPLAPAGIPILAATAACIVARRVRPAPVTA